MAKKSDRAIGVNSLTKAQIIKIVQELQQKKWVVKMNRAGYSKCTLKPTKDKKGNPKHPQCTITQHAPLPTGEQHKQLVHLIWWRYANDFKEIPEDLHISHLDKDQSVLHLTAESREMNESRKYCHLFGWYKTKEGEEQPRCPHKEVPCTGP